MKQANELIPWTVTDISIRPYEDMWSFNPSLNFDGQVWRCVLRCCDYAMPDGVTIRSKGARTVGQQTRNAMVIFDPQTWKPAKIFKMHEKDDLPRISTPHVGYEDMRLFRTDKGGLQGIAASLHLKRGEPRLDGSLQNQPPEQVIVSFDDEYNIVKARPIRGDGWSGSPQKNWVPFDDCAEPRFLYSISKGSLFDDRGAVHGDAAAVRASAQARTVATSLPPLNPEPAPIEPPHEEVHDHEAEKKDHEAEKKDRERSKSQPKKPQPHPDLRTRMRAGTGNVQFTRGKRVIIDAQSSRPSRPASSSSHRSATRTSTNDDAHRQMGSGRILLPKYNGLRGGTQLVRVGDDAWLGIGHEMKFVNSKKHYWHVWYLVDSRGKMTASSAPMKLASKGIEFAAGMGIDGDRVVVSFGVDDMECKLGVTSLSAVMQKLHKL